MDPIQRLLALLRALPQRQRSPDPIPGLRAAPTTREGLDAARRAPRVPFKIETPQITPEQALALQQVLAQQAQGSRVLPQTPPQMAGDSGYVAAPRVGSVQAVTPAQVLASQVLPVTPAQVGTTARVVNTVLGGDLVDEAVRAAGESDPRRVAASLGLLAASAIPFERLPVAIGRAARGTRGAIGGDDLLRLGEELDNFAQTVRDAAPGAVKFEPFITNGGEVHLANIEVPAAARGQGIGTQMMESLLKWADERGLPVTLDPRPSKGQKGALERFYRRLGFRPASSSRNYHPESSGEWYRSPRTPRNPERGDIVPPMMLGLTGAGAGGLAGAASAPEDATDVERLTAALTGATLGGIAGGAAGASLSRPGAAAARAGATRSAERGAIGYVADRESGVFGQSALQKYVAEGEFGRRKPKTVQQWIGRLQKDVGRAGYSDAELRATFGNDFELLRAAAGPEQRLSRSEVLNAGRETPISMETWGDQEFQTPEKFVTRKRGDTYRILYGKQEVARVPAVYEREAKALVDRANMGVDVVEPSKILRKRAEAMRRTMKGWERESTEALMRARDVPKTYDEVVADFEALATQLESAQLPMRQSRQRVHDLSRAPKYESYQNKLGTNKRGVNYREHLIKVPGDFVGNHWEPEGVLAHVRTTDRPGNVLHIDEVQSDWMQGMRKYGLRSAEDDAALKQLAAKYDQVNLDIEATRQLYFDASTARNYVEMPRLDEVWTKLIDERNALAREMKVLEKKMPHPGITPDTQTWAGLAMKQMLERASREGYDVLSWASGKQAADMFDLRQVADELHWYPDPEIPGEGELHVFSKGNRREFSIDEDRTLEDYVGKDIAKRLRNTPEHETYTGWRVLKGDGLVVGGHGMEGFYDEILPGVIKSLERELGVKLPVTRAKNGSHQIKLTPAIRQRVIEKGFTLPSTVLPVAGAAGGAMIGDTPEERTRNALLGGALGLGGAMAAGRRVAGAAAGRTASRGASSVAPAASRQYPSAASAGKAAERELGRIAPAVPYGSPPELVRGKPRGLQTRQTLPGHLQHGDADLLGIPGGMEAQPISRPVPEVERRKIAKMFGVDNERGGIGGGDLTDVQKAALQAYLANKKRFMEKGLNPEALGSVFDDVPAGTVLRVPQEPIARPEGPLSKRGLQGQAERLEPVRKAFRKGGPVERAVVRGVALGGQDWYNLDPVAQRFVQKYGPDEGLRRFQTWVEQTSSASPRARVAAETRQGVQLYNRAIAGLPVPSSNKELLPGTGSLAYTTAVAPSARGFRSGNPPLTKVGGYSAAKGGNWSPYVVDVHAARVANVGTPNPADLAALDQIASEGFERMADRGVLPRTPNRAITSAGQAAAWVGTEGVQTAVAPYFRILEDRVYRTATAIGMDPKALWKEVMAGRGALYGLAGVGLGLRYGILPEDAELLQK